MEERKRGLKEEKTRARGRKFRSKTTHNPFLRWTEQDDAALIHASILSSLFYPWSAGQCYAFVSLEREDPPRFPICIHTAITSFPPFFRIFLERKRERERRRATLCFIPSSILSAIKNVYSRTHTHSDRKAQFSLFSRFFFSSL